MEDVEFPDHIEKLNEDYTVKCKILRVENELKAVAKENPDLNVSYDETEKEFKFIWTFLGNAPIRLPIDYQFNGNFDKQFLLRQMFQAAYSHGYEQKGKEVIDNLKNLLEL